MVICLEQDEDLHMAQLMPLSLTVSCFSKIQIGFTFLVSAHPGSPGQTVVKRVCVCVLLLLSLSLSLLLLLFYYYYLTHTNCKYLAIDSSIQHDDDNDDNRQHVRTHLLTTTR